MSEREMKLGHEHPFTVIENGGQLLCPRCEQHLDESYRCKCCPYSCCMCGGQLSGSCYACKLCWPEPYIAHQSCFELPEEIQIADHPSCLLYFERDVNNIDCYFCNEVHMRGFKYRCGDCDFQIGVGCASKLINFHEGQQHVEHFSHRHPLTLLKLDDHTMTCKLCLENIDGHAGYGCVPCEFYIHNSCREFPQEIKHPFHPRHCLTLVVDKETNPLCEACCFEIQGFRYRCDEYCQLNLHPVCTYLKPKIKYTAHEHLLIFVENLSYQSTCEACGFDINGVFFMRCVDCRLNFHVQCGSPQLPPIVWHKQHEHPLNFNIEKIGKEDSQLHYCSFCQEERNPEVPFYNCAECGFLAHVGCAITEVEYDDNEKLRHFSHKHVLILSKIYKNNIDDISCYGCGEVIQGSAYGCDPCRFYLHKSCVELPNQIWDHQSHEHYLTLQGIDTSEASTVCDACKKHLQGFRYGCDECNFHIDLDCASLHPSVNLQAHTNEYKYHEYEERIGHFSHHHHLVILEVPGVNCKLCHKYINGQCYGCAQCEFYIHNSCGELLREIRHPFHPRHSLKLVHKKKIGYLCDACCFDVQELRYRCEECVFDLHPECLPLKGNIEYESHQHLLILVENMAMEDECDACYHTVQGAFFMRCVECSLSFHVQCVVQVDEREKIKHFSHKHFLFLVEHKRNDDIICPACEENIIANPVYGCDPCKFYLHKSCAEVPRERQHPFHRHSLTLLDNSSGKHHRCNACHKHYKGFSYCCQYCNFHLDLECCLLTPSIKIEPSVHDHALTFFKKLYGTEECHRCKLVPPNNFSYLDAFYVRCVKCNFSHHLMCCPLPQTLVHDSHPHPIILVDNFVDLFDGFDDEEYCCDVCETRRDARECVYHCEGCNFVVDLECVFSEVMQILEEKHKDVELRIVSRKTKGSLTYKCIVESLTEEEKKMMKSISTEVGQKIKEGTLLDFFNGWKWITVRISEELRNVEDHELELMAMKLVKDTEELDYFEEDAEIVNVRDHKITPKLAPVLNKLLDKYADFYSSCSLTQSLKTILIILLCLIIKHMRKTKVMDIGYKSIIKWWFYLKLVERAGFRVDFAFDHVKSITTVSYFLKDNESSIKDSPLHKFHKEMPELSEEIDDLKAKIEKLKKNAQDTVSSYGSEQLRSEAKRFNEVMPFKWKNATAGLLDDDDIPKL